MKFTNSTAMRALLLAAVVLLLVVAWKGYAAVGWSLMLDKFPLCG